MTDPAPRSPRRPFPDRPPPEPFYGTSEFRRFGLIVGGLAVVSVLGFFILSQMQRNAAELAERERQAALPKLLSPDERQARQDRLSSLFEGALLDSENATGFGETAGYHKLLQVVASYPPGEIEERAVRRLDYAAAMADPDAWRGEFVWARGIVLNLWAERLRDPVFGATDVYRGILSDGDGRDALFFDLPDRPPEIELRKEAVDVFGVFYRTAQYEPLAPLKGDPPVRNVPYLVVKSIRRVVKPRGDPAGFLRDNYGLALVGAGVVIFGARLLIYLFQRRSRRSRAPTRPRGPDFKDLFETKLRQDRRTMRPGPKA
jgi:hypothetical protein